MRLLVALLAGLALAAPALAQSEARYRVTFESTWSQFTHPLDYPGNAHYSSLVGATHASSGALWAAGSLASEGIEEMAETGATFKLRDRIAALQVAGQVGTLIEGPPLSFSPSSVEFEIDVSEPFPLVSLVTMVAPSPDWFVGVSSLYLRDGIGGWQASREVELHVWDAGTDSGSSYTAPNQDTQPRELIRISEAAPFAGGNTVLGAFRFELLSVVDADEGAVPAFAVGTVTPTPSAGAARLSVTSAVAAEARLDIVDVMGRTVATQTHTLNAGERTLDLPTAGLAPGSYAVRVRVGDEVWTRRLVVAR